MTIGVIMQYVFFAALAGLFGAILLGIVAAVRKDALPLWGRVIAVLLLLAPIPFSLFGFAASFEPGAYHWVWRISYAIVLLGCVAAIIRLCWPRSSGVSEDRQAEKT